MRLTIAKKIFMFTCILIPAFFGIAFFISYHFTSNAIFELTGSKYRAVIEKSLEGLDMTLEVSKRSINYLSGPNKKAFRMYRFGQSLKSIKGDMRAYLKERECLDRIRLVTEAGEVILDTESSSEEVKKLDGIPAILFERALQNDDIQASNLYVREDSGSTTVTMAKAIYDKAGKFYGVIMVDINGQAISNPVYKIQIESKRCGYLIDKTGLVLISPDKGKDFKGNILNAGGAKLKKITENMLQFKEGVEKGLYNDIESYIYYYPFEKMNWIIAAVMPEYMVLAPINKVRNIVIGICCVFFILIFFISYFFFSDIKRKFNKFLLTFENMSQGNIADRIDIKGSDEFKDAAISFNRLVEYLQEVVSVCEGIGVGDYNRVIQIKGENDLLGNAIDHMTTILSEAAKEQEYQNWVKTCQMEMDDAMRGIQDITTLAANIIKLTCTQHNAKIGAIYLNDGEDVLRLVGTYAYGKRKNLSNEYRFGEGLVGQAALERRNILITNVPDDYITIKSGLGEAPPRNILAMPFLYEGKTKCVVEIGSFKAFRSVKTDFLRSITKSIATAFNTAQSRLQMQNLLSKTETQGQELQAQQEELRQTNEELEEQTQALKEQKGKIEKKNLELEKARGIIEEKARALEITSKYKSEFLANMSHELRTPLNSLLILSNLLVKNKDGNLSEKEVEFAGTINGAGKDLLNLINEVLDLSKVEAGKMELNIVDIELADFSGNMERNFRHLAEEKGLALDIILGDGLPESFSSDRQRVEQVVKNFFSNAFKFTEKGGITFSIDRPGTDIDLSLSGLNHESAIAIAVIDTGKGIAPDKQKLIFEAFQQEDGTTSRKFGGTGLGLSISRELARFLGGEIQLESEEGKGSTFTLYLPEILGVGAPAQTAKETGTRKTEPETAPVSHIKPSGLETIRDDRRNVTPDDKSILIIEDDPRFAKILFELAHKKEFKCMVAGDGETGLHFADYYRPSAIVLDIGLPGIDGWTVMERLKKNPDTRHIPVHFVSASDEASAAMKMGAIGYQVKPVSMDELDQAFERIEGRISKTIKRLLVVEDDEIQRKTVVRFMSGKDIEITAVGTGKEAYDQLKSGGFDCMILDLGLPDYSEFELLEKIKEDSTISHPPIIVYTAKEFTKEEEETIKKYAESVVIKGAKSRERLLDEASLFLHSVEAEMPEKKQKMLRMTHDKDMTLKDKKILMVDDDMRNVFALTNVLEEKGMKVLAGKDGKEGLEKLENNPDVDLVLMDIMMPEMDGYEAMREIRKKREFAKLPIIALTAKAMKGDRDKCIEAGANDYLAKPVDMDKLLSLVRVWLYGRG